MDTTHTHTTQQHNGATTFPRAPPHQTPEDYAERVFGLTAEKRDTLRGRLEYWLVKRDWKGGGLVTSWYELDLGPTGERCVKKRAMVRGDGKILGSVDAEPVDCSVVSHQARQIVDRLEGVEALGMYKYSGVTGWRYL
jgi:hypothetical protein